MTTSYNILLNNGVICYTNHQDAATVLQNNNELYLSYWNGDLRERISGKFTIISRGFRKTPGIPAYRLDLIVKGEI